MYDTGLEFKTPLAIKPVAGGPPIAGTPKPDGGALIGEVTIGFGLLIGTGLNEVTGNGERGKVTGELSGKLSGKETPEMGGKLKGCAERLLIGEKGELANAGAGLMSGWQLGNVKNTTLCRRIFPFWPVIKTVIGLFAQSWAVGIP